MRTDHDLLIELHTDVKYVRATIAGMESSNTIVHGDHEKRIRSLETRQNRWVGKESIVGGALGAAAGIVGGWISLHK